MGRVRLIPGPQTVRVELAKTLRQADRLRQLLRVAEAHEADRQFIEQEAPFLAASAGASRARPPLKTDTKGPRS